ncbi:hypothetical protein [Verrucomicrobium spinosum]|uniref:hypothetical protein n=1 Tax=Verrucomicrobium spinosum TaxID=2736 RepID=UPI00210C0DC9|nr:hypothetical protein [Verrucomicrobium spinosum]
MTSDAVATPALFPNPTPVNKSSARVLPVLKVSTPLPLVAISNRLAWARVKAASPTETRPLTET